MPLQIRISILHQVHGRGKEDGENVPLPDLKNIFGVDEHRVEEAMDILRPWNNLVPVTLMGNEIRLPENNSLWRGLQFWGLMTGEITIDFSIFCIAGTCKNCKTWLADECERGRVSLLACQSMAKPGIEILKLPHGFTYRPKSD